MTTVTEIKQAILNLSKTEYAQLIEWLYELEEEAWDKEVETDSAAGRLEFLKAEADAAKQSGTLEEL